MAISLKKAGLSRSQNPISVKGILSSPLVWVAGGGVAAVVGVLWMKSQPSVPGQPFLAPALDANQKVIYDAYVSSGIDPASAYARAAV